MIKNKNTYKYFFVFCIILSLVTFYTDVAYGQQKPMRRYNHNKPVNFGFRIGFNSGTPINYHVYSDGVELSSSIKNKTGYLASSFFRINLEQFFMQPEFEWSLYKQDMKFSLTEPVGITAVSSSMLNFSQKSQSANVNILVGYSIIKNGPFRFNAFAGPSFKFDYASKYNYSGTILRDNDTHFNTYGIVGFSLSIANFYADMRYEININDTDINFDKLSIADESLKNIKINKRENILSFSCGVIF